MISSTDQFVAFTLDEQEYALPLSSVDLVVHMVEVTPLPGRPDVVTGIINLQGRVIPVLNIRKRFALPPHESDPGDHLIIAHTSKRTVSIPVNCVTGVIKRAENEIVESEQFAPGTPYVAGVTQLAGRIVLIHDLDRFLSLDEESRLTELLGTD